MAERAGVGQARGYYCKVMPPKERGSRSGASFLGWNEPFAGRQGDLLGVRKVRSWHFLHFLVS